MIKYLYILCCILVIYIYLGYPFIVYLVSGVLKRNPVKGSYKANVSIIIAAYNEEKYIEQTVLNKLAQNYSHGKIEVIVVSDGSNDSTNRIVEDIDSESVILLIQVPRQGKTSALNMAIEHANGEIIIFSDANSIYAPDAVEKLVNNFVDPQVGYVTGKMIYSNPDGSVVGDGCDTYMRYENFIRFHESKINSIVGVDGGIDAIRKRLYHRLNPDQLPDFVQPLKVVEKGYRVVYEPDAILKEDTLSDQNSEYRMRVRVTLRALWALLDMRNILNPIRYPVFSWQLLSHKVLRYSAWLPLIILLLINPFLLNSGLFYQLGFIFQSLFYSAAVFGYCSRYSKNQSVFTSAPYYFVLTNIAAGHAFIRFSRGEKTIIWTPRVG